MEAAEVEPRLECFVKALRDVLWEDQQCCLLNFCANVNYRQTDAGGGGELGGFGTLRACDEPFHEFCGLKPVTMALKSARWKITLFE